MSAACEKDLPDRGLATLRLATWSVLLGVILMAGTLALVPTELAAAGTPVRREQEQFMWAMAGQESGWDYYARNASSGAFGRYQIMPFNWPVWAAQYLGDGRADQTPWNQETVAFAKIGDLYRWLGSWKRVAYWWLTGQTDGDERHWSSYAQSYVSNIMQLRQRAPHDAGVMPARTASRSQRGDWRRAAGQQRLRLAPGERPWPRHGAVAEGQVLRVRHATTMGSRVRWIAVVTRDGRLGWLPQSQTLPATRPSGARKWRDVDDRGRPLRTADRRLVRPRPR
jgi:hypothetical protein